MWRSHNFGGHLRFPRLQNGRNQRLKPRRRDSEDCSVQGAFCHLSRRGRCGRLRFVPASKPPRTTLGLSNLNQVYPKCAGSLVVTTEEACLSLVPAPWCVAAECDILL